MSTNPLVSIILTTWNRAALLPRAIASVRAQRWTEWELLVEDDGSTDETESLLASIALTESRMSVSRHDNFGPARSRNLGMTRAAGDIITFLDSDDEYETDHLRRRVRLFLEWPEVLFIHGGVRVIGDFDQRFVPDLDAPDRRIAVEQCAIGGTFFARRGVIEVAGGWRDGYGEDADLLRRIRGSCSVLRVEDPTYVYHRETSDSRCTTIVEVKGEE